MYIHYICFMPIFSMYGMFTDIWVIFRVDVGKYSSTTEWILGWREAFFISDGIHMFFEPSLVFWKAGVKVITGNHGFSLLIKSEYSRMQQI